MAGGRGRRLGGLDKGLVPWHGQPLVAHIANRLRPQVSTLLISANRNTEVYGRIANCPVIPDSISGYAGPLAGIARAMQVATTRYIVTVPCDAPFLASDLVSRLYQGMTKTGAEISVARDEQRVQPMFALLQRDLLPRLLAWLQAGEHRVQGWFEMQRTALVALTDRADMFYNLNKPEDRTLLEKVWERLALEDQ